jgi:hypothetical protein
MSETLTKEDFDTGWNSFIAHGRVFDMREPDWEKKLREHIKQSKKILEGKK